MTHEYTRTTHIRKLREHCCALVHQLAKPELSPEERGLLTAQLARAEAMLQLLISLETETEVK